VGKAPYDIAVVSIDYDEGDPRSYRGIAVTFSREGTEVGHRFETGDPQLDWAEAKKVTTQSVEYITFSSSVDQFISDGGVLEGEPVDELWVDPVRVVVGSVLDTLNDMGELDEYYADDTRRSQLADEIYDEVTPYEWANTI
jgi:hypothetical protein